MANTHATPEQTRTIMELLVQTVGSMAARHVSQPENFPAFMDYLRAETERTGAAWRPDERTVTLCLRAFRDKQFEAVIPTAVELAIDLQLPGILDAEGGKS